MKVKIKGTNKEGYIVQRGPKLVQVEITKNFNAFDRTVYSMEELEVMK